MNVNDNGLRLGPVKRVNWSFLLIVNSIGIAGCFQLFSDSVVGNIYPPAKKYLLNIHHDENTVESIWENIVATREYGVGLGCLISIVLNHFTTLQGQLLLGTALDIAGLLIIGIITFFNVTINIVGFGRFLNGLGHGIVQIVGAVFILEVAPQNKRGSGIATTVIWGCAGEMAGLFFSLDWMMGNEKYWKVCMIIPLVFLIPAFFILMNAPQSPRYLFNEGLEVEGRKSLNYYQDSTDARISEEEILRELAFENSTKGEEPSNSLVAAIKRFTDGQFVLPLLIACGVQVFVHLDDWLWVSFSTPVFEKIGATAASAQLMSLFMIVPQTFVAYLGCRICDRYPRKHLLLYPSAVSAVVAALIAGYLFFKDYLFYTYHVVVFLAAVDLSTAAVSGEGAQAIVAELFLSQDKVMGTAIAGMAQHGFGAFLTTYLLTYIDAYGTIAVLVPFSLFTATYVILNYRWLPETSNKNAQELAGQFSKDLPFSSLLGPVKKSLSRPKKIQAFMLIIQMILCYLIFRSGVKIVNIIFSG